MELIINSGTLSKVHSTDAGFDIYSSETIIIPPNGSASISTNLTLTLPPNTVGIVKSRSGLSFNFELEVGAGVIDETYSGEIKVHIYNHGTEPYRVIRKDKIAQLLIIPILHPTVTTKEFALYHAPSDAKRDTKGFGSTGS